MKIGIVTQPLSINYGGILQNYALQTLLKNMGHEVVTLDPTDSNNACHSIWQFAKYVKRAVSKYLFGKQGIVVFYEKKFRRDYPIISQNMIKFINQYINVNKVYDYYSLKRNDFDALIVGSDQVWRPRYNKDIKITFLSFAKKWKVKKISYAASFGTNEWEFNKKQTKSCAELVRLFDAVSVRESSGVDLCSKYLGVKAHLVLDPTMLLNKDNYMKLVSDHTIMTVPKNRLLCCILDKSEDKSQIIKLICERCKIEPLFTYKTNLFDETLPVEERIQPSVEEWLCAFENSKYVVTDSYHATIFSILFKKQFIAIGNTDRGLSRFHSLLNQFDLGDRLINSPDEYNKIMEKINYDHVFSILSNLREVSMNFLNSNL